MDVQDVVLQVAPWVALVGSSTAVVSALTRYRVTNRLRTSIERDSAMLKALGDGPGSEAARAVLEHEIELLRQRVVEPRRATNLRLNMIFGVGTVVAGGAILGLTAAIERMPGDDPAPDWVPQVFRASGLLSLLFGMLIVILSLYLATAVWFVRYRQRIEESGEPSALQIVLAHYRSSMGRLGRGSARRSDGSDPTRNGGTGRRSG